MSAGVFTVRTVTAGKFVELHVEGVGVTQCRRGERAVEMVDSLIRTKLDDVPFYVLRWVSDDLPPEEATREDDGERG